VRRKRIVFVEEYLKDFNATQAAIRAGYSERSAHSCGPRLLENADVKVLLASRISALIMSTDEILLRIGQEARDAVSVTARLRALEMLGKYRQLFMELHQITTDMKVAVVYDNEIIECESESADESAAQDPQEQGEAPGIAVGSEGW